MDADLSHHPKYIPVMIEYNPTKTENKNKAMQISWQVVATVPMEELKDGNLRESWQAEQRILLQNLHLVMNAVISQEVLDSTKSIIRLN